VKSSELGEKEVRENHQNGSLGEHRGEGGPRECGP